jgi:ferredoxin
VQHWGRDWEACDSHRSPYGFAKLTSHIEAIMRASDAQAKKDLLRSETTFNLWQSILRGAGVITGCRRCADVCPVGDDYPDLLADALEAMPEDNEAKRLRLVDMVAAEADGRWPDDYLAQQRWIGRLLPKAKPV